MHFLKKFFLIIMIMTLITVCLVSSYKSSDDKDAVFLSTNGFINIPMEKVYPLSIIFIDDSKSYINKNIKDASISFDNSNIKIKSFDVKQGDRYKDIMLYSLNLDLQIDQVGNYNISKLNISYNGANKVYEIGNIIINCFKELDMDMNMDVISNTASSDVLNKYEFKIKNINKQQIEDIIIYNGQFQNYVDNIEYKVNENIKQTINYLNENDLIEINIKFKNTDSSNIYYFSPVLNYKIGIYEKQCFLPYAIYGLPIDEKNLNILIEKYNNQQ